jgi:hypothetical protein
MMTTRIFLTQGLPSDEGPTHTSTVYEFTVERWPGKVHRRVSIPGWRRDRDNVEAIFPEQEAFLDGLPIKKDRDCAWRVRDVDAFEAALAPCRVEGVSPTPNPDPKPDWHPDRGPNGTVTLSGEVWVTFDDALAFFDRELAGRAALPGTPPDSWPGTWLPRMLAIAPHWRDPVRRGLLARWLVADNIGRQATWPLVTGGELWSPSLLEELAGAALPLPADSPLLGTLIPKIERLANSGGAIDLDDLDRLASQQPALLPAADLLRARKTT